MEDEMPAPGWIHPEHVTEEDQENRFTTPPFDGSVVLALVLVTAAVIYVFATVQFGNDPLIPFILFLGYTAFVILVAASLVISSLLRWREDERVTHPLFSGLIVLYAFSILLILAPLFSGGGTLMREESLFTTTVTGAVIASIYLIVDSMLVDKAGIKNRILVGGVVIAILAVLIVTVVIVIALTLRTGAPAE